MSRIGMNIRRFFVIVAPLLLIIGAPPVAVGGLLYPSNYASLGTALTGSGYYSVDTRDAIIGLPDGREYQGVISDGVAVFTFGSIDLSGASFIPSEHRPFALLSQGNLRLSGVSIDVNAYGIGSGAGGNLNPVGRGSDGVTSAAGGGGFGGEGADGGPFITDGFVLPGGRGGARYGGLAAPIQGGAAGGDYGYGGLDFRDGFGGGGGGAVELGANRTLSLIGVTISANGGDATGRAAGGGSGGSISLLGAAVDIDATSSLSAKGGSGTPGFSYGGPGYGIIGDGGGGGGGRIEIMTSQLSFRGSHNVSGATDGVIEVAALPEPPSSVMAAIAITIVSGYLCVRRGTRVARRSD